MLDYLKAELLRFRSWALAYLLLHVAVLGFLTRVVDLAQQTQPVYQLFGAVYALSGLLLGAYQMGSYRRPNAWVNLLHRPVGHRRLAGALMLAAAALLLAGVLVPLLLAALWQHALTARVLDVRHLGLALSGWLLAVCGYLAGAFALLASRRHAVAAAAPLVGLCYVAAVGVGALVLQAVAAAWLAGMVLAAFKPDLAAPPRGLAATALVGVPLQVSMWLALMLLGLGFEVAWLLQGTHPNILEVPVPGSSKEADRAEARALMQAGLEASRLDDAALWREQAAISDVHTLRPNLDALPVRHQLTNPAPLELEDRVRRVRWVFSHDALRFEGYSLASQRAAGTLGLEGGRPFPGPPVPLADRLLATRGAVYQYDDEAGRILERATLPAGETLIGLGEAADRLGLLSQRALYLYDQRDLRGGDAPLVPRVRVPMPGRAGNLTRVELLELVDGVLVSFTFTRGPYDGLGTAFQEVLRVDEQGRALRVSHRALASGYSPLYAYSHWYTSPLLHALRARVARLFSGYVLEHDAAPPPVPPVAWALAGTLSLLSALVALWRTQRLALPPRARGAWVAGCALVGLPALLSLWLLYPPRERLDDLPVVAPLPA